MESKYPIEACRSLVQGFGVFAIRNIKKDEIIEECPVIYVSHHCPDFYNYGFVCKTVTGKSQDLMPLGYGCVYNHSNNPSAFWVFDTDKQLMIFKASRDIATGEEIFIYYSDYWFAMRKIPRRELSNVIATGTRKRLISLLIKVAGFVAIIWLLKKALIYGCSIYFLPG